MGMGHQDKIDRGQMMDLKAGLLQALDHFQPLRPNRIDQDIDLMRLNEEGGVPDPGDADLALADFRELRAGIIAGALGEERRDEDFGEEIAFMPIRTGTQFDPGGTFVFRAVLRGLANDVPPAFFRKRDRHGGASI